MMLCVCGLSLANRAVISLVVAVEPVANINNVLIITVQ